MQNGKDNAMIQKVMAFVRGEVFSYLFFGVCTTIINILSFQLMYAVMGIPTLLSNAIAWVFSVMFAYITNRIYVFHSEVHTKEGILREVIAFVVRAFAEFFTMAHATWAFAVRAARGFLFV